MKQVNFSHEGGFPLEQEALERLQTAYRSELFEALKSHLSIEKNKNYIVAHATSENQGWAIIHQEEKDTEGKLKKLQGILYPIQKGTKTDYLKTTRTGTNLTYGTGVSQTAYFDYEASYISPHDFNMGVPQNDDALAVYYYDLNNPAFIVIKDIKTIEAIIETIETKINSIKNNISAIETNIRSVEADMKTYLPLNGLKAMEGDLDLGSYKLSKLDIKESPTANVRVTDFRLGSTLGRAIVNDNTNLTLNYGSDWHNTHIGGKVYLNNLNTSDSIGSLLVVDNSNQVTKSNTVLESLIQRITDLEQKPATAVPKGMVAIWGKPAPFPEGWEEYTPLRGRMPVGFDNTQSEFNTLLNFGGSKSSNISVPVPVSGYTLGENTSRGTKGRLIVSTGEYEDGENLESIKKVLDSPNINFSVNNLNPYRVVQFIQYIGIPSDTTAPTNPTNLTVSNIGTTSLTLSWTAANDNVGVTNYVVSINGDLPFSVGNVLSYNVTGLSANTHYSFSVQAKDAAGNSSMANTVDATTLNAPIVNPTVPKLTYGPVGEYLHLEWPNFIDSGLLTYELYRSINGGGPMLLQTTTNTFYDDKLSNGLTYSYQIRINSNGYKSPYSNTVTVTGRS